MEEGMAGGSGPGHPFPESTIRYPLESPKAQTTTFARPEGGPMPTPTISNVRAGYLSAPRSRWCRVESVLATLGCLSALAAAPALAQSGADGEWTMPAKDYSSTRFSKLAEITA